MRKGTFFVKSLTLSIILNICLILTLFYYLCIKTDMCYKALAKIGIVEYNIADVRHSIEYRCLEGWNNCLRKLHIQTDVVFYGNSITYESDFQQFFPKKRVCNLGCNRDDLDDLIHRSFIIKGVQPRKIFVLGGINRLNEMSLDDFEQKYSLLVDTIIKQNPSSHLYLQSMLPVNVEMEIGSRYEGNLDKIKQANQIIKNISERKKCTYVDLYSLYQDHDTMPKKYTRDGLHLHSDAYLIWAQLIEPYVE